MNKLITGALRVPEFAAYVDVRAPDPGAVHRRDKGFWGGIMIALGLLLLGPAAGISSVQAAASESGSCLECTQLNQPHKPFRIYGNTYFVGTQGLSSILITSDFGHVLVDAGLPESAPLIKANIEALGFKVTDIKAILSSHAHIDQAGGIAALQRESGADVYAVRANEPVLLTGRLASADPQSANTTQRISPVPRVWILQDDQLLGVGSVRVRVVGTPGHAPGGTSWTWESCEGGTCLNMFYADNLAPEGAGKYRFKEHPEVLKEFEGSFRRMETASCDVLLTARPDTSQMFQRLDPQGGSRHASIKDDTACRRFAKSARDRLASYVAGDH